MAESYYRTGQAAKQLGVSSYHVRRLCEAGEIAAELSEGQQWKIPASEIARRRRGDVCPRPFDFKPSLRLILGTCPPNLDFGLWLS